MKTIYAMIVASYALLAGGTMLMSVESSPMEKAPPPPVDDSLTSFCGTPAHFAFCQSFCAHNPNPSCFASCCAS
jgi:hypothetical protein